ncbi:hypothetical protein HAX54_016519 [Datura stramonium]|uniref:BHLH domain-containing protein n=1 Tax=Datura stramonium TaxID=4076 RepID=A0ABS8S0Q5_DATST|nr:hypothetical protein [Datura stramonium]
MEVVFTLLRAKYSGSKLKRYGQQKTWINPQSTDGSPITGAGLAEGQGRCSQHNNHSSKYKYINTRILDRQHLKTKASIFPPSKSKARQDLILKVNCSLKIYIFSRMDMSSPTWWSEMDIMNMNDLQYIDNSETMSRFDDLPFDNNPFTSCTYDNIQASQAAGIIFEEKPAFCSSTNAIYQINTSSSSSPSVISFSNSDNSPSSTTAAQNYFENLNTVVKREVQSGTTINFSSSKISPDSDYDDSQHLFQAMGFGAGDITQTKKSSYNRTPLQAQDHVLAERKRRERLTQYFVTLSTLIPNLKKLDKASILGDAIKYIKQLEEQVKCLEEETKKYSEEPVVAVKRARLLSRYENSNKSVPVDIDVRASDGNVLISICCKKQARIIKEIFSHVEMFHLTITSSSVIPFGCNTIHITIVAQMDHQLNMATEFVANKLRFSILKLINSHEEANSLIA